MSRLSVTDYQASYFISTLKFWLVLFLGTECVPGRSVVNIIVIHWLPRNYGNVNKPHPQDQFVYNHNSLTPVNNCITYHVHSGSMAIYCTQPSGAKHPSGFGAIYCIDPLCPWYSDYYTDFYKCQSIRNRYLLLTNQITLLQAWSKAK